MKYTYKRTAGIIFIILGISIVSRFIPSWLFNISMGILTSILACLLYFGFYN